MLKIPQKKKKGSMQYCQAVKAAALISDFFTFFQTRNNLHPLQVGTGLLRPFFLTMNTSFQQYSVYRLFILQITTSLTGSLENNDVTMRSV